MSNNAASASVIQMRDFDRPAPSQQANQFERLLEECQELALGSAEKSVSAMFDKVETRSGRPPTMQRTTRPASCIGRRRTSCSRSAR